MGGVELSRHLRQLASSDLWVAEAGNQPYDLTHVPTQVTTSSTKWGVKRKFFGKIGKVLTSPAIYYYWKNVQNFKPIFEQNADGSFEAIFEQNQNFESIFKRNVNFEPIFEQNVNFEVSLCQSHFVKRYHKYYLILGNWSSWNILKSFKSANFSNKSTKYRTCRLFYSPNLDIWKTMPATT